MKLKTKLIPIFTAASTAAVIAPLTLTSCGEWIRYTDLLNRQYESWVTPHEGMTVHGEKALEQLYTVKAMGNTDIIRDDILWSFSTILHNTQTKALIDQQIKYSEFNFDIIFTTKTVFDRGEWKTVYCADLEAHVAGEVQDTTASSVVKDTMIDEGGASIKTFDFYFNSTIYGLSAVEYVESTDEKQYKDLFKNGIMLSFDGEFYDSIVETTISGSYVTDAGTTNLDNKKEVVSPTATKIGLYYGWLGVTVLGLLSHADSNQPVVNKDSTTPDFAFGSHYLQNIEVKK